MWIQVEDIHDNRRCINLDYVSCINPKDDYVEIVYSDNTVAHIKPTFTGMGGRKLSTYIHLCSLLTDSNSNFC